MMHVTQAQLKAAEVRKRLMGIPKAAPAVKKIAAPVAKVEAPTQPRVLDFVRSEMPTFTVHYHKWQWCKEWQWSKPDVMFTRPTDTRHGLRNWSMILNEVLRHYPGVTAAEVVGAGRSHQLSHPRWVAWYRCRTELGMSYPQIAKRFKRDHSTVLYGIEKLKRKLEANDEEALRLRLQVNSFGFGAAA